MVKTVETALPHSDKETEEIYPRNGDTVYRVCLSFMKNRADVEVIKQWQALSCLPLFYHF